MTQQKVIITPIRSILAWSLSAATGAVGLALNYGFHEPAVEDAVICNVLAASLALFLLSRLLMLVPFSALGPRLRGWWVDFVMILAAAIWWFVDRTSEPVILRVGALYSIVIGLWTLAWIGVCGLAEGFSQSSRGSAGRRLFIGAVLIALLGGAVLTLPINWQGPYPVEPGHPLTGYHLCIHSLDCLFTATAALSGTGLACREVGVEFSRVGLIAICVLMQIGGLAVLIVGSAAGWRLRRLIGWGSDDDDLSSVGLRRLIRFVLIITILIEAAGAYAILQSWNPAESTAFTSQSDRILAGAFHSISAFCNVGFALPTGSLIDYRGQWTIYSSILPLMVLGSLGGPVLYELFRRLTRRGGKGLRPLSKASVINLLMTVVLIVVGTAGLVGIESSLWYQLRYPREDTPGRINLPATAPSETQPIVFSSEDSASIRAQQMREMPSEQRWSSALFQSIAARSGGMYVTRLDEQSLTPASRVLLMILMLIGGGLGGSAGGLKIIILILLIQVLFCKNSCSSKSCSVELSAGRQQAIGIAAAVALALTGLIIVTTFALVYREAGSLETCFFEAVSACCNVGFSTGLTPSLSLQGRGVIILAMLLGKIVPLIVLLRCIPPINEQLKFKGDQESIAATQKIQRRVSDYPDPEGGLQV